jgi:hypothetical protein
MPKLPKVPKIKRYSIDFYISKKQGIRLFSFTDFRFIMPKIPGVCKKDGATRGASACAARATPQF